MFSVPRAFRERGDPETDGHLDPRAVRREDRPLLERRPDPLGELRRAFEVGARQHDRELLPAPPGRHVDLADALAQGVGELAEDCVADGVAEAVVDRLEAVEVRENEGDRAAEALGAKELAGEGVLALAAVREAREHVDEGLARDDPVQPRVFERNRGMRDQRRGDAALLETEIAARERERPEALAPRGQRQLEALATVGDRPGLDDLAAEPDDDPCGRARCLDDRLDDHAQQLVDVVGGRERVAEADGRLAQPRPLRVELVHPLLELIGHLVERDPEARELVPAGHLHPPVEPAARDRVRGVRQAAERDDDRAADHVGDEGNQDQRAEDAEHEAAVGLAHGAVDSPLR